MTQKVPKKVRLINLVIDLVSISLIMEITFRLEYTFDYPTVFKAIRLFLVMGGYYFLLEYFTGQTVGKLITGTKVVGIKGSKPPFHKLLVRTACRYVPIDLVLPLMGADVPIWHDSKSGTKVFFKRDIDSSESILDYNAKK